MTGGRTSPHNIGKGGCIIIIGIDPGTGRCGYSVLSYDQNRPTIVTYGTFEYASHAPLPERLVAIEKDVATLLEEHKPSAVAVETLIFNRNITTAMQVSEARGVIVLSAAKRNIPVQNCTPLQVKMAITGYGRADKSQVKQMIKLQMNLKEMQKLDDAVDAIAIGVTGYHLLNGQSKLSK